MFNFFENGENHGNDTFDAPRDLSTLISSQSEGNTAISQVVSPQSYTTYKKSKWTPEEDRALIESVKIHGTKNWIAVASLVPDRNSKQCRERWTAQLDPTLNHNEFTPQEDAVIILQHQANGPLWAKIASYLPGRSATAVKNRFNWLSRRHLPQKMNRFFLSGTTPMENSSGSLSPLGIAPFAMSDPMNDVQKPKPKPKEPSSDGEFPEDPFGAGFFDFQDPEDDAFNF